MNFEKDLCEIAKDLRYLKDNIDSLNEKWKIEEPVLKNRNALGVFIKRCVRKLTYWLIWPEWQQQMAFNQKVTAAISDICRIQCSLFGNADYFSSFSTEEAPALPETDEPRIIQLVSSLRYGDAVGNEVMAYKAALQHEGYVTETFALDIHSKLPAGSAKLFKELPPLKENDVIIYHFASESPLSNEIAKLPGKKVLRYHNVTPPEFFHGYDASGEKNCKIGLQQVVEIQNKIDFCLPVSEFNKQNLIEMGYRCPMEVVPILIQFEDYAQPPDQAVIDKYNDGKTNLLFVGRMAPNKKVEDVISAFAYYKEHYDHTARLFLVGSFSPEDKYYQKLVKHIDSLGVQDVIFPGHIAFNTILAYYSIADVFLCMSEHEGFCVPLVEAMYFKTPIIAYDCTAIPFTLGKGGILVKNKDCKMVSENIHTLLQNVSVHQMVVQKQTECLENYESKRITSMLLKFLEKLDNLEFIK